MAMNESLSNETLEIKNCIKYRPCISFYKWASGV